MVEQDFSPEKESEMPKNSTHKEDKPSTPFENLSKSITTIGSRLRVLEERYSNIRKKSQMIDENLLDFEREIREELRSISQDILDLKRSASDINENLISISAELKSSVRQDELKVFEKYLEMWQPMNFLTKSEAEKMFNKK